MGIQSELVPDSIPVLSVLARQATSGHWIASEFQTTVFSVRIPFISQGWAAVTYRILDNWWVAMLLRKMILLSPGRSHCWRPSGRGGAFCALPSTVECWQTQCIQPVSLVEGVQNHACTYIACSHYWAFSVYLIILSLQCVRLVNCVDLKNCEYKKGLL